MPHPVRPREPLAFEKPELLNIPTPVNAGIYSYGFNTFLKALEQVHPQPVTQRFVAALAGLKSRTDVDILICPREHAVKLLNDEGLMNYFHAIERRVKPAGSPITPPIGSRPPSFLQFKHDEVDYSVQIQPLVAHLHSSCQTFYDLRQHVFMFKNKECYERFIRREIYTPELAKLIHRAHNNLVTFRTLIFLLKNHLKARVIGWTLSQEDREMLQELNNERDKTFVHRINAALSEKIKGQSYVPELLEEFGHEEITLGLLLVKRDREYVTSYLTYDRNKTVQELLEDLRWLENDPTCLPDEKQRVVKEFCMQFFSDAKKSDDDKKQFIAGLSEQIKNNDLIFKKEWVPKSPVSRTNLTTDFTKSPTLRDNDLIHSYSSGILNKRFESQLTILAERFDALVPTHPQLRAILLRKPLFSFASKAMHAEFESQLHSWPTRILSTSSMLLVLCAAVTYRHDKNREYSAWDMLCVAVIAFISLAIVEKLTKTYFYHTNIQLLYSLSFKHSLLHFGAEANPDIKSMIALSMLNLDLNPERVEESLKHLHDLQSDPRCGKNASLFYYLLKNLRDCASAQETSLSTKDLVEFLGAVTQYYDCKSIDDLWSITPQDGVIYPEAVLDELFTDIYLEITRVKSVSEPLKNKLRQLTRVLCKLSSEDQKHMAPYETAFPSLINFIKNRATSSSMTVADHFRLMNDPLPQFLSNQINRNALIHDLTLLCERKDIIITSRFKAYHPESFFSKNPSPTRSLVSNAKSSSVIDLEALPHIRTRVYELTTLEISEHFKRNPLLVIPFIMPTLVENFVRTYLPNTRCKADLLSYESLRQLIPLALCSILVGFYLALKLYKYNHKTEIDDLTVVKSINLLASQLNRDLAPKDIQPYCLVALEMQLTHQFNAEKMVLLCAAYRGQSPSYLLLNIALIYYFLDKVMQLPKGKKTVDKIYPLIAQIAASHGVSTEEIWHLHLSELSRDHTYWSNIKHLRTVAILEIRQHLELGKPVDAPLKERLKEYMQMQAQIILERIEDKLRLPSITVFDNFIHMTRQQNLDNPAMTYLLYTDPYALFVKDPTNRAALAQELTGYARSHEVRQKNTCSVK